MTNATARASLAFDFTDNRPTGERKLVARYMRLAKREPRLLTLLTDIMAAQPTTDQWYMKGWRDQVIDLVGFARKDDPVLGTSDAYETVYELCYSYVFDGPRR